MRSVHESAKVILGIGPETGLGDINRDFLEADVWPGIISGLPVIWETSETCCAMPECQSSTDVQLRVRDGYFQSISLPATHVRTMPPTHIWDPFCST